MAGKFNCTAIVLAIIAQFLRVHSRYVPLFVFHEPQALLSWEGFKFPVEAPIPSEACQHGFICENVQNYPTELAAMLFNKLSLKNITKFTNDDIDESDYDNELGELKDLCESKKEKIMFPRAAKDLDNKWQFILNMPGHKFQSFRVHECLNGSVASCSEAAYIKNKIRYRFQCEQKFTKRKMVYLNLEQMVVAMGVFEVPSCCSCFLKPR